MLHIIWNKPDGVTLNLKGYYFSQSTHSKLFVECTDSQRPDPQNRPLPMVTNPIYEGAVYETLDLRLNSLAGNTFERPKTPTTPTSSTAPLILESPYAITNLAPSYAEINPQSKVNQFSTSELDNSYTVMTPAGVANKGIPAEPMESNLDQDVRYAREPVSVSIPVTVSDW